jgi:2-oxoisovalerate dehydrogenase E1 component
VSVRSDTDVAELKELFRQLYKIRRFEERTSELFQTGAVAGTAHSCIGQEAIAVGASAALAKDDFIVGHHRSHGHVIAKGGSVEAMMAELLGKRSGYCRGLGGSMHIADLDLNILGCNGVVGAGLPIGCGAGLSSLLRGSGQVAVSFFGDGAANQGMSAEAMNLAATWSLPLIFVCENNQFALSAEWREIRATEDLAGRAEGFGIPAEIVDGNDVLAVHDAVARAVSRARDGGGPSFIECKTYRLMQHSMRANLPELRDLEVRRDWEKRDPLLRHEARLRDEHDVPDEELEAIRSEVEAELDAAIEKASADTPLTEDELAETVYAPARNGTASPSPTPPPAATDRQLGFNEAIAEALTQEMEADDSVVVIGEDVGKLGGIFGSTRGLYDRFGGERVRNTPISEGAFVGAAVGAALTGLRPVVEIQIFDFVTLAMDSIVNQAAKFRFMTGGKARVPLVVRGPAGAGVRLAAQHSQSLESWFAHIPGLIVIAPSGPADAKGLLAAAIQDDNPVVFIESKSLFFTPEDVSEERYTLPIGKAAVKREGTDVTLVATQGVVPEALRAARALERESVSVEVIDPRTLYPLDIDTILESIAKTSRVVVAHEAVSFCGIGAEIAAEIADRAFWDLDAPVKRVTAPHRPMAYERDLERAAMPASADIVAAIKQLS